MRSLAIFVLAACGCAAAQQQATVVQGYASTFAPSPLVTGTFVPLVNTPEVSFDQPALSIGASNATEGLVAGASSATGFNQYEVGAQFPANRTAPSTEQNSVAFDSGGLNQPEVGVASLINSRGSSAQPLRTFTNDDVEKLNQQTGTVKYKGKTEEVR